MFTAVGGRDLIADGAERVGGWLCLLSVVARLQFRLSEVELGALVFRLSVGSDLCLRLVWRLDPLVMTSRVPSLAHCSFYEAASFSTSGRLGS